MVTILDNAIKPNQLASTNPIKNLDPNAGLAKGTTGSYNPKTTALTFNFPDAVKTQSTTTLTSDKSKDIVANNATLDTLSQKGVTTTTTPDGTMVSTTADGAVYDPTKLKDYATADTSVEDASIQKNLDEIKANTDAITAAQIASIQNRYAVLKENQAKVNASTLGATTNALLTSGAAQHDVFSDDAIKLRLDQNAQQLKDLENEENDLINAAKAAQLAGNNKILEAKNTQIQATREKKQALANKMNEDLVTSINDARKAKIQADKDVAISNIYAQGTTDPATITQKLKQLGIPASLKEVGDTVAILSGVGGTGIVGEYNFYKADAIKRGLVPVSFDEYQNLDANRKKSIAKAGVANIAGYSPTIISKVTPIAAKFGTEQAVKNYQAIAESVDAVRSAGTSPVDDIQRIYAVAKVLDPSSAVKEGEYATIEKYAQALFERAGKKLARVFDNVGFLTTEARTFIQQTLDNRLKSSEKAFNNIKNEYAKKINKITGGTDGEDFITDYSAGFTTTGDDIIQSETEAETKITNNLSSLKTSNPTLWKAASDMFTSVNSQTGQPYTAIEILQAFPELNQ